MRLLHTTISSFFVFTTSESVSKSAHHFKLKHWAPKSIRDVTVQYNKFLLPWCYEASLVVNTASNFLMETQKVLDPLCVVRVVVMLTTSVTHKNFLGS